MKQVENLIKEIITGIVSDPTSVEVFLTDDKDDKGEVTVFNVKVAKHDIGICIGKKGETAEALRKIIGVFGYQQTSKRVYVKIDAPKLHKNHFDYGK